MPKRISRSIAGCVTDYLSQLFDSPRTMATYATGLRMFQEFLTAQNRPTRSPIAPQMADLDTDILQGFQAWLAQKTTSRFSQRTYLASTVAFLSYSLSHDWLPSSFSLERARAKLKHVTRRSSYPIPHPDPGLPRLIAYYDNLTLPAGDREKEKRARLQILRSRAFVHLLYSSAGRLAEVAALSRKDVADGRRNEALVTGKGDKQRYIFITPDARAAISAYIAERQDTYEPLFISHGRNYGRRLSHDSLWITIKKAAGHLGIDVSPHDFRHYRASQMLQQGAPLEAIQEILGHSDISTTRRVYAHYSKPAIRAIFERTTLPPDEAAKASEAEQDEPTPEP
ncbi:MAG: tyrosine-type recombinase/integrase [Rudaea sp.]